jgi:ribonuclease HI
VGARLASSAASHTVSEYTALIDLLEWAASVSIKGMVIRCDSLLVVNQTNCVWGVKIGLAGLCAKAFGLLTRGEHTLLHVKGHNGNMGNEAVDALCNEYLDEFQEKEESVNTPKEQHGT